MLLFLLVISTTALTLFDLLNVLYSVLLSVSSLECAACWPRSIKRITLKISDPVTCN